MAMYLVSIYQMPEDFIEKHNEIVNYFIAYLEALMVEKEVIRCGCTKEDITGFLKWLMDLAKGSYHIYIRYVHASYSYE